MTRIKDVTKITIRPTISTIDAAAKFSRYIKSLPKSEGANDLPVSDWLFLCHLVLANYQTFNIDTFLSLRESKPALSVDAIKRLFPLWVSKMQDYKKVRKIPSCYDQETFEICG